MPAAVASTPRAGATAATAATDERRGRSLLSRVDDLVVVATQDPVLVSRPERRRRVEAAGREIETAAPRSPRIISRVHRHGLVSIARHRDRHQVKPHRGVKAGGRLRCRSITIDPSTGSSMARRSTGDRQ